MEGWKKAVFVDNCLPLDHNIYTKIHNINKYFVEGFGYDLAFWSASIFNTQWARSYMFSVQIPGAFVLGTSSRYTYAFRFEINELFSVP